ncbi:MAG: hypothetical protein L3J99_06290 [Thermoplasmata archaeon]|nr:hypothetical protein [Thermoplasmata archaeon]
MTRVGIQEKTGPGGVEPETEGPSNGSQEGFAQAPTHPSVKGVAWGLRPIDLGWILLLGFLIRESLSFWTGHPYDFEIWIRTGHVVALGSNPYGSLAPPIPGVSFSYTTRPLPLAAYPPVWSTLLGLLYRTWEGVGGDNRFILYFLLKQPPILGDVGSTYLLYRLALRWTGAQSTARSVAAFWAFSPYAILVSAVWGQFDSLIVLTVLTILWVRTAASQNLLIALGIVVKWFTVVLLPFELLRRRRWGRLWPASVVFGLAGLAAAFFWATGWGLANLVSVMLAELQGTGGGMNFAHLLTFGPVRTVAGDSPAIYGTLPYLWVPAVVGAGALASRWVQRSTPSSEVRAVAFITAAFLLTRWGLNEQYMVYLFALLALDVAAFHPQRRALFRVAYSLSLAYLIVHDDLGAIFLGPIRPDLVSTAVGITASGPVGDLQVGLLLALAVLLTAVLVQVVYALWSDEESPRVWLTLLLPSGVRAGRPPGRES